MAQYNFYVTAEGMPVRLHMFGQDMFSGSHFDTYIADYHLYRPGVPDPAVFERPIECTGVPEEATPGNLRPLAFQMATLLPAMPPRASLSKPPLQCPRVRPFQSPPPRCCTAAVRRGGPSLLYSGRTLGTACFKGGPLLLYDGEALLCLYVCLP